MATPDELEWPRTFPARALRRLVWFVLAGALVVAVAWILFGTEPDRLPSGQLNPMAGIPRVTSVAIALLALPVLLALVRRPAVTASHYALSVRPGVVRTLVLPWAGVAEIAGYLVRGEPLLLVRCGGRGQPGDRPRWCDQAVLRAAVRAGEARRAEIGAYDVAVRMDEFAGPSHANLATLAARAPRHVLVTNEL